MRDPKTTSDDTLRLKGRPLLPVKVQIRMATAVRTTQNGTSSEMNVPVRNRLPSSNNYPDLRSLEQAVPSRTPVLRQVFDLTVKEQDCYLVGFGMSGQNAPPRPPAMAKEGTPYGAEGVIR